jgi:hypothetical protein
MAWSWETDDYDVDDPDELGRIFDVLVEGGQIVFRKPL